MPDYNKAIIYTIRSKDNLYVGSTCNFRSRKYQHKVNIHKENNKHYNLKIYKIIRDNDFEWDMKPYKEFPCENKLQLSIEEERIRQELNADMNTCACYGFNRKEYNKKYNQENKEHLLKKAMEKYYENPEYNKEYYQQNKEIIAIKVKKYREQNQEKVKEQRKKNKEKHKEKIRQASKLYYQKNKEKIKEKAKEKRRLKKEEANQE
jgi:hypothetical protein